MIIYAVRMSKDDKENIASISSLDESRLSNKSYDSWDSELFVILDPEEEP